MHSKVSSNWNGLKKLLGLSKTTTFVMWTLAMLLYCISFLVVRVAILKILRKNLKTKTEILFLDFPFTINKNELTFMINMRRLRWIEEFE